MRYSLFLICIISLNSFSQVDAEGEKIPDPHRFYLGIMAAPEIADSYFTISDPSQLWFKDFVNEFYSPKFSYTAGTDFLFVLNQRFTLQSGIHYSNRGSRTKKIHLTDINGIPYDPEFMNVIINFHYIEAPLKVNYNINFEQLRLYFSGGIITGFLSGVNTTNKLFYQSGDMEKQKINELDDNTNRLNLSATLGTGFDFFINSNMSFRIEPNFKLSFLKLSSTATGTQFLWNSGINFSYMFGI